MPDMFRQYLSRIYKWRQTVCIILSQKNKNLKKCSTHFALINKMQLAKNQFGTRTIIMGWYIQFAADKNLHNNLIVSLMNN